MMSSFIGALSVMNFGLVWLVEKSEGRQSKLLIKARVAETERKVRQFIVTS